MSAEPITDEAREAVEALLDADGWAPLWQDDNATIHTRLVAILSELPAIGKDAYNQQQSFHYRSHDDVLNALNPLLAKHGVVAVPYVLKRATAERTTANGKAMYEVNLLVQYEFYGLAGDSVTASAWGEGTDMGDKATNKAMTMAFKNVIAQVFAISTAESYDTDGGTPEETRGRVSGDRSAPSGTRAPGPTGTPPASALLVGAIEGEGFLARLAEAYKAIDPTIDWTATVRPALPTVFGVETREQIPEDRLPEYWRRMANAEVKLRALVPPDTFPPPAVDDEQVLGVLAWAFDGAEIPVLVLTEEAQAKLDEAMRRQDDDVPWPGEESREEDGDDAPPGGEAPSTVD